MPLKEDKQALALPDKGIDTSGMETCKGQITSDTQFTFRYVVPPGMCHGEVKGKARGESVIRNPLTFEDPETLVVQAASSDAVKV
jgi:hypothetical protein